MKSSIVVLVMLALGWMAHADAGPSVWDQMKSGSTSDVLTGKIKSLQIHGQTVTVTILDGEGHTTSKTAKICSEYSDTADQDPYRSDEMRAIQYQDRVHTLREAKASGQTIQISYRGPWNPCLESADLAGS